MFKYIKNILLIFGVMVIVGYLALICVYALPTEPIKKNVAEASNIMQMDGSHPELVYGHQDTMLDNLTDSIMLLISRYDGTETIFEEALLNNRFTIDGLIDSEVLAVEAPGEELRGNVSSYGRYWHGYLLYLKPLLMLLNYGQIRYVIAGIQFCLFVFVLYLFVKKNKEKHVIPFVTAYMFLNPAVLALSLQYFPATLITMIELIIILLHEEKYKIDSVRWFYHFFAVGGIIAYFDFLTYPVLTLGMPLAFLMSENRKSIKEDISMFVSSCVAWGCGYVAMWGSKWILGSLLTEENMIADALRNILIRVGITENGVNITKLEVIMKNIGANKLYLLLSGIVFGSLFLYGVWKNRRIDFKHINVCVLLCAGLPFVWYIVVSNHSYIHFWFTYRVLAISIYSILIVVSNFVDEQ